MLLLLLSIDVIIIIVIAIITTRFYAEHGIAMASHLSVMLRYCDHIGWNNSKIISRLISMGCLVLG